MNANASNYNRDANGRLRPCGAVYENWQARRQRRPMVAHNNLQTNQPVDEEPLPLPTMNGHKEDEVVDNSKDENVLPLPQMTFGSVRRPVLKTGPIQNTDDDGVLPLPVMKFE